MEIERHRWIHYRGKEILVADYSHLAGDEYAAQINEIRIKTLELNRTDLLTLVIVNDSIVNKATLAAFKRVSKDCQPLIKKSAIVGIDHIKVFFLRIVNVFSSLETKPFDTVEEALEWLTS